MYRNTDCITLKKCNMKKMRFYVAIATLCVGLMSCNKSETQIAETSSNLMTKAYGDKTPKLAVYVETNDVNPLNAGDYMMNNTQIIDIVELFASNIHKTTVNGVEMPTLYLNDKLAPLLINGASNTYVKPLHEMGMKVLLTVLGDWQHIGVANMTDAQTTCFANILAWAVEEYGLDGIGFDDEYADYNSQNPVNNTSFSQIITKLHALLPSDKLITVFDWGNTDTLSPAAVACIDYAYHGNFGAYNYYSSPGISGLPKSKWSPISLNLGNSYSSVAISSIQSNASSAKNGGYGAIMCFNLRKLSDRSPIPVFQALANGAYSNITPHTVTCTNGNRLQPAAISGGYEITCSYVNSNPHTN